MTSNPELIVMMVIMAVAGVAGWRLFEWVRDCVPVSNPWDHETEARIQAPGATPLCLRCLEPHDTSTQFCGVCGLPVDYLVNWPPYLYLFALGDILITGTGRKFQVHWITITGFLLLSFMQYAIFAPLYWFLLFRNIKRRGEEGSAGPPFDEVPPPQPSVGPAAPA